MINFNHWGPEDDKLDFERINAIACGSLQTILSNFLPGGRIVSGNYVCGTIYGGQGDSCSTNVHTGVGSDFAAGIAWGDPIDLVAKVKGIKQSESAKLLSDFLSITSSTPTPKIEKQSSDDKYAAGKKNALEFWVNSDVCPQNHPYLAKKQVNTDNGIRLHRESGQIIIPLYDERGDLWSVQRISPDGSDKKINNNGKMTGNFFTIEGDRDTVFICEGYATAKTVAMATGKTSIMAVSTGNLAPVADKIVKLYPGARIIFAADNDQDKPDNPGVKAAEKAIKAINQGSVIAPPFPAGLKGDWNDYAIEHGGAATRNLLLSGKKQRMLVDVKTLALKEPEFLIEDMVETPCTGMIFGPSGSGKSFFVFDLAMHVATGKPWEGHAVKQGSVIYICGEGRHAIPRRIKAWEHHHKTEVPFNTVQSSTMTVDFEPEIIAEMIAEIDEMVKESGRNPVAVFIDTMARALPGQADENSAKDVGLFIKECDRIQTQYGCSVIIVHHSGHQETKRARGTSSLKGAMDVEIFVSKEGVIEWTKTKDIEPHKPVNFSIEKVCYGEGRHDNSCVLKYDFNYDARANKLSANMKAAVKSLYEAVEADGLAGCMCLISTWRDIYKTYMGEVSDRAKQKSFKEQMKAMEEKEMITVTGNKIAPVKLKEELITDSMFSGLLK